MCEASLIQTAIGALRQEITQALSEDPTADVSPKLQRVEQLERELSKRDKGWPKSLLLSFLVAAACITIIAVSLNWHVSAVELSVDASTTAVEIVTYSDWAPLQEGFTLKKYLGVRGASTIVTPGSGRVNTNAPIRIASGQDAEEPRRGPFQVSLPTIPANSRFRIACTREDTLEISITGPPINIYVLATGGAQLSGRDLPGDLPFEIPAQETLHLSSAENVPLVVTMSLDEAHFTLPCQQPIS